METKNIPADYGLRLGIQGGHGCGGVSMVIGFDKKKDTDLIYTIEGIPYTSTKNIRSVPDWKKVDFYEGDDARGFMFVDEPYVKSSPV